MVGFAHRVWRTVGIWSGFGAVLGDVGKRFGRGGVAGASIWSGFGAVLGDVGKRFAIYVDRRRHTQEFSGTGSEFRAIPGRSGLLGEMGGLSVFRLPS